MVVLLPLLAVAAPVPKAPAKKMADIYGEIVYKEGKHKYEMTDTGELTITSPNQVGVNSMGVFVVTPLVAKKVEGDFVVTYRAKRTLPSVSQVASGNVNEVADTLVGLGMVPKPGVFGVLTGVRSNVGAKSEWESSAMMHSSIPGRGEAHYWEPKDKPDQPCWIRLTRRGTTFTTEFSSDGDKWKTAREMELPRFAGTLLVGPVVAHNTNQDVSATFTHYELKDLPAEKK
jgi:hypothetical protein